MIHHGDCLDILKTLPDNSVDSMVTDPPYFLTNDNGSGFMGKEWDSLSPKHAIVESYFRSMKLVLNTEEESSAQDHVNIEIYPKNSLNHNSTHAQSAQKNLKDHHPIKNQNILSAQVHVITREEALVLSKELLPSLIKCLQSLPIDAFFVINSSTIDLHSKNIARNVAFILNEEPRWLDQITSFIKTENHSSVKFLQETHNGIGLENKSTNEIIGLVENVASNAEAIKSNAITLNPTELQRIITKITSLPYVKAAINQCMKSPSFTQILSEVFHRKWAREVYRVLKPGAHGLIFGGTRVYHRLTSAFEDEGYEIRDCIQWVHGQGFPKSLNLEKALNKLGRNEEAEKFKGYGTALKPAWEPIILVRKPLECKTVAENVLEWGCGGINIDKSRVRPVRCEKILDRSSVNTVEKSPGLEEAESLTNSVIKNATVNLEEDESMIHLNGSTKLDTLDLNIGMIQNQNIGTSLNIDSFGNQFMEKSNQDSLSIISTKSNTTIESKTLNSCVDQNILANTKEISKNILSLQNNQTIKNDGDSIGRWPSNFILSHNDDCELLGEKRVKAITGGNKPGSTGAFGKNGTYSQADGSNEKIEYGNADGTETVSDYSCTPGCSVAELDRQSGQLHLRGNKKETTLGGGMYGHDTFQGIGLSESGYSGASRFFQNIQPELPELKAPFFYSPKASKKDKNEGCEGLEKKYNDFQRESSGLSQGKNPITGERTGNRCLPNSNHHPTVKSTKLMSYLITLITPPGGVVLDPFAGSFSTGVAAIKSGFRFIGIEKESEYFEIGKARIENVSQTPLILK